MSVKTTFFVSRIFPVYWENHLVSWIILVLIKICKSLLINTLNMGGIAFASFRLSNPNPEYSGFTHQNSG